MRRPPVSGSHLIDFLAIQSFCLREHISMVIVGPEEPLVNGIYDYFQSDAALRNIALIGPSKEAARFFY